MRKHPNSVSGIYAIKCLNNGKLYIGRAFNVHQRFSVHLHHLRKGSHANNYLQHCYNKYGENSLIYGIIEECPETELSWKEVLYIEEYKTTELAFGMNLMKPDPKSNFAVVLPKNIRKEVSKRQTLVNIQNHGYMTFEEANLARSLYKQGFSISELCDKFNRGISVLYSIIRNEGRYDPNYTYIKILPKITKGGIKLNISDLDKTEVIQSYLELKSIDKVKKKISLGTKNIRKILMEAKIL